MKLHCQEKNICLCLAAILLLIATWFGARSLNADPYWVDEVIAVQRAGTVWYDRAASIMDTLDRTAKTSDQVPGYYVLLALWSNIMGTTPFAGRLLSLFFGLITIAGVYQIGKRLSNELGGFASALSLVSSAFYVLFLHEMRMYSLLLCLIVFMMWFYWLIIHGKITWWTQMGLVLTTAGMMYSYYLSIVIIVSVCFYHLIFVTKNREWWRVVILMGLAGILFLPWMLTSFSVFQDTDRNAIRYIHKAESVESIIRIGSAFSNKNNAALVFLLLFALQWWRSANRFVVFILVLSLTLMVILNEWQWGVFVNLRYSLMLWIPLTLVVGLGIERLVRFGIHPAVILGVIFASGVFSVYNQELTDEYDLPIRYLPWDTLTNITQNYEQDGDTLVFLALIEGDDWEGVHEERVMPHYFYGSPIETVFIEDVRNLPDAAFLREGEQVTQDAGRVWLSYAPKLRSWRTAMFQDMLTENGFTLCGNFADSQNLYLDLYAHPNAVDFRESFQFGDGNSGMAQLTPLEPNPHIVDDTLVLIHAWTLNDSLPRYVYSLAVHVIDDNGNIVAQGDYALPESPFACQVVQIPVNNLASGHYRVRSFVYAWEDNSRMPLVSDDGFENTEIILGEFTINR